MRLREKMSCILEELTIQMDSAILTISTVPYNMKTNQHAMEMNEKVRNINEIIRQMKQRSVLPVGLLDVADMMERSFPDDASSDGIHFDRPKGVEWLNGIFQKHINTLEADLLELGQFTFGPPPVPPFFATSSLSSCLGMRLKSRDSPKSSRTRLPGSMPMEAEEVESSTPPKIGGILGSGGGLQEGGKTDGDEPDTVSGEVIGIGSRRSRMQTRVGGDPEAQAHVT